MISLDTAKAGYEDAKALYAKQFAAVTEARGELSEAEKAYRAALARYTKAQDAERTAMAGMRTGTARLACRGERPLRGRRGEEVDRQRLQRPGHPRPSRRHVVCRDPRRHPSP